MRLSIEQAKKYLRGMHRLWLCDEWEQPYDSERCRDCDSHDDCLDIVLAQAAALSDIAQDLLDTIEALQQENEQLQAQLESLRCSSCGELPELIATDDGDYCEKCAEGIEYEEMIDLHTYHNPADVEALRKAREALITTIKGIDNKKIIPANTDAAIELWRHKQQIQEALTEIDKTGGKEDV